MSEKVYELVPCGISYTEEGPLAEWNQGGIWKGPFVPVKKRRTDSHTGEEAMGDPTMKSGATAEQQAADDARQLKWERDRLATDLLRTAASANGANTHVSATDAIACAKAAKALYAELGYTDADFGQG